jgi:cytochrome b
MTSHTKVWDLPTRIFHWALAASFACAYVLAESERLRNVHVALGYTVLGLLAFRLVWGFIGPRYARFSSFVHSPVAAFRYLRGELRGRAPRHLGHNPAGSWAVFGLLILGVATGVTGYLNFNELGGESMEDLHEAFANAWLVLVGLHILGVVFSSVMQRENLARSMITGFKRGTAEVDEPRNARGLGLAMVAAILGFWGYTATSGGVPPGAGPGHGAQSELATEHETDDD